MLIKNAAAAQHAPGPLLSFPADGVEHHIHTFPFFLEMLVGVIRLLSPRASSVRHVGPLTLQLHPLHLILTLLETFSIRRRLYL
jgi:hypothetical protein